MVSLMIRARRALEDVGAVMKKSLPTPKDATFPGMAFSNAALALQPEQWPGARYEGLMMTKSLTVSTSRKDVRLSKLWQEAIVPALSLLWSFLWNLTFNSCLNRRSSKMKATHNIEQLVVCLRFPIVARFHAGRLFFHSCRDAAALIALLTVVGCFVHPKSPLNILADIYDTRMTTTGQDHDSFSLNLCHQIAFIQDVWVRYPAMAIRRPLHMVWNPCLIRGLSRNQSRDAKESIRENMSIPMMKNLGSR